MMAEGPAKCFGFVNGYDQKPKRRLFELLTSQGLQMNQAITFLSDGGDTVRELQLYLSPQAEHLLDWFHLTMRITVMKQMAKGIPRTDQVDLEAEIERVKWYLWHGNVFRALQVIEGLSWGLEGLDDDCPAISKLRTAVEEFRGYLANNSAFIPNYGDRYRYGEVVSTAFVESTINQVVSEWMVKKQQMRWTPAGGAFAAPGAGAGVERRVAKHVLPVVSGPVARGAPHGECRLAPVLKWSPYAAYR
jgi:hypothetical protein